MEEYRHRITELEKDVAHLKKDMWHGNGKPGLTSRMQSVEDKNSYLESEMAGINAYNIRREEKNDRKQNIMLAAICSMIATLVVYMIIHH